MQEEVPTEFSIAKGFHIEGDLEKGMFLVNHCLRIIKECNPTFWVIENPATGKLKDFLGEPDFIYQPWEFGSPWTKKTALWGKFNKPNKIFSNWENIEKIEIVRGKLAKVEKEISNLVKAIANGVDAEEIVTELGKKKTYKAELGIELRDRKSVV